MKYILMLSVFFYSCICFAGACFSEYECDDVGSAEAVLVVSGVEGDIFVPVRFIEGEGFFISAEDQNFVLQSMAEGKVTLWTSDGFLPPVYFVPQEGGLVLKVRYTSGGGGNVGYKAL